VNYFNIIFVLHLNFFILLIINNIHMFGKNIGAASYDILRAFNTTVWGGVEGAKKASRIVKGGLSGADALIGTSHAFEDLGCQDYVCASLDVIGSVSSAVGIILGNIESTKYLTVITGSVTVGCRSVRYYCKRYGTFWGCSVAATQGIKEAIRFTVKPPTA
jgi:hypothetical protein